MKSDCRPTLDILFLVRMNFGKVCFVGFNRFVLEFTVHAGPVVSVSVFSTVAGEMIEAFESLTTLVTD